MAPRLLKLATLLLATLYIAATTFLFITQRDFIYPLPKEPYLTPKQAHAPTALQELPVTTTDNLHLIAWYAPPTTKNLTIVYFHGNGDDLRRAAPTAIPYLAAGYGFLAAEYRGYGGMPGQPTETNLYADARTTMKTLIAKGTPENHIVLFGYSLGTGVATQMATEFHTAGLILLAPYLSLGAVAQYRYPILPANLLTTDRFDNEAKIAAINTPLLLVNGNLDTTIPPTQGHQLFNLAHTPKQSLFLPNRTHNNLLGPPFTQVSLDWLAQLQK